MQEPQGTGIRVGTHCFEGYMVPPFYDSLLAKVITVANNRSEAIDVMQYALQRFFVSGVDTTIPFLSALMDQTDFKRADINTRWLEEYIGD